MTALEILINQLQKAESELNDCITEAGYVKSGMRYQYQEKIRIIKILRQSIDFMRTVYNNNVTRK